MTTLDYRALFLTGRIEQAVKLYIERNPNSPYSASTILKTLNLMGIRGREPITAAIQKTLAALERKGVIKRYNNQYRRARK